MSKGLPEILNYVNEVTGNVFSIMILIGVYILVLMGFYKVKDDFAGAMAVSGFATFVVSLLFWLGGFVSGWVFSIVIGMAIVGVAALVMDGK